ncbi:MAG: response regulator transcription factor [Spongiibacteraceae bacterium]
MRLLLVEDDISLGSGLKEALSREGFAVNLVTTGALALAAVRAEPPDIMILDLGLPDMDGLDVLSAVKKLPTHIPVLLLTARTGTENKVTGLDKGADDYLAKPFDIKELAARLRVFERRLTAATTSVITIGGVELDTHAHSIQIEGQITDVSRREYMLLKALMENAGKVLTRESLETRLYSWGEEISSNAIEVHIHNLRKRLPDKFIKTVRGIGYTVPKQ